MKPPASGTARRGFSIIELLVTLAVTSIVVTGSFWIFQEGLQLFRTHQASADAQIDAMKVLSRIASEVVNTTPSAARAYPLPSGAEPPGLVFANSTTPSGLSIFDSKTGAIAWQRYVSFYYKPDPAGGDNGEVWRAEVPVTPTYPSSIASGNIDIFGTIGPWVNDPAHSTAYFQSQPKQSIISRGISGFSVEIYTGTVGGDDAPTAAARRSFNVVVEAGNKSNAMRNGYYIKMESRVTPRG